MSKPDHHRRPAGEEGASSVEYAILVSLIAVVIITAVALLGSNLSSSFHHSCASVAATHGGTC
ncbi:MAG: Flp family type IVb pilin [Actinomycetes bacterium]